ncbi:hypothetical protein MBLNU459_g7517t1 [Dothideomycetes sp. NU459]
MGRLSNSKKTKTPGAFPRPVYDNGGFADSQTDNLTRALVVAKTSTENTDWISESLHDDALLDTVIYTVDDPAAANAVPQNKGHEVMVYLTYIIDNYDQLRDVTMFMHAHLITWHNNDLLDSNAAEMIRRLSTPRVLREGYMNMRCHLDPGCPAHIRPLVDGEDVSRPEAAIIGRAWQELFPAEAVPDVLSQPCCAQVAVSRARVRALPRAQYVFFRDWLLRSALADNLSGRVFEYVWQYIWAGTYEFCPSEHVCYCDGYGVCFAGEDEYALYFRLRGEARELRERINAVDETGPESGAEAMRVEAERAEQRMQVMREAAFERGNDPRNRALAAGRVWRDGDGF